MFEINLVPDVKEQAIKAIKLRNLIFFICIVVVGASVALLAVLSTIKAGQDIAMTGQDEQLENMSKTLGRFSDLDEILTIQSQLKDLSTLNARKTTLSRIFNVVDTLLPTNGDTITISELNVNLDESTISFDAQARANVEPRINFNVLNAFKQSMGLMRYDYGRYVDENDNEIPTLCVEEKVRGAQVEAIWARAATGCDPSNNEAGATADNDAAQKIFAEAAAEPGVVEKKVTVYLTTDGKVWNSTDEIIQKYGGATLSLVDLAALDDGDEIPELTPEEEEKGYVRVIMKEVDKWVTISRVPKFSEWYDDSDGKERHIELDGMISGAPHFESACITYAGLEDGEDAKGNSIVRWSSENGCNLVPDEITVMNATDGRNADGEMVLRFSAVITFDKGVFAFDNKHVITIGPTGKTDVTDSYLQIEGMFEERSDDWRAD